MSSAARAAAADTGSRARPAVVVPAAVPGACGSATRECTTHRTRSHRTGRPVASAGDQDRHRTRRRQALGDLRRQVFGDLCQTPVPPRAVRRERLPQRLACQPRRSGLREQPPATTAGPTVPQNLLSGHRSAQAALCSGCPALTRITGVSRSRIKCRLKLCPLPADHQTRVAVATA